MEQLPVELDDPSEAPEAFRRLVAALPGEWRIEGAGVTWRGQRTEAGILAEVGLGRRSPADPWILAWRANAEIPDDQALLVMVSAIVGAALAVGLGAWAGLGGLALLGGVVAMGAVIAVGRIAIRARLPDPAPASADLGDALRRAVAEVQGVRAPAAARA